MSGQDFFPKKPEESTRNLLSIIALSTHYDENRHDHGGGYGREPADLQEYLQGMPDLQT
jgi:hypothetical protein